MLPSVADAQRYSQNRGQGNSYQNRNQRNYHNQRGRVFRAPRRPRVAICLPPIPRVVPYMMGGRQNMRRHYRNHHYRYSNIRGRGRGGYNGRGYGRR